MKHVSYRSDSGTIWHGDLEGTTKFVFHGIADIKTYASVGTSNEVFTGSMVGVGSGHLRFREKLKTDAQGTLTVDATIVGSDGALDAMQGTMHFAGKGVPSTGEGSGTYTANFTASAPGS